jgi:hypothetical protein
LIEVFLGITHGLIGNHQPSTHQILHSITILAKLAAISLLTLFLNRPEIFPFFYYDDIGGTFVNIGSDPAYYGIYRGIVGLFIAIAALSTLEDVYKIVKLEKYKL